MAENNEVKSKRDRQLERLRGKYPEKKFEDDEEIYGQIYDDYDGYEQELDGFRRREKVLSDMFAADPRSAQFLTDMHQGRSPWASYIRLFGPELKDSLDDPDVAEQIAAAEKEYVERVSESRKLDEEYESNMRVTLESLRQYQQDHGLTDEQIDEVMGALLGIVRDGVMGKFVPETLDMMSKALNHDADVESAREEGNVMGRNERAIETLRKGSKGDGTSPLGGRHSLPSGEKEQRQSIFDLAAEAR